MAVAGPGPRESEAASQAHPEESRCLWGSARRPQLAIGAPGSLAGPGVGGAGRGVVPGARAALLHVQHHTPGPPPQRGACPRPELTCAQVPVSTPARSGPSRSRASAGAPAMAALRLRVPPVAATLGWGPGLGGRGGRWAAGQSPPRRLCTSPSFSGATWAGEGACLPRRAGAGTRPGGFFLAGL